MRVTANEIEKMKNNSLPKYERFFFDVLDTIKKRDSKEKKMLFEKAEMQAIANKMTEMFGDKTLSGIERPLDVSIIKSICDALVDSGTDLSNVKLSKTATDSSSIDFSTVAGKIEYWNLMMDVYSSVVKITTDSKTNYDASTKDCVLNLKDSLKKFAFCLKSLRKFLVNQDASTAELIPAIKEYQSI
jgi:hypothetical protein